MSRRRTTRVPVLGALMALLMALFMLPAHADTNDVPVAHNDDFGQITAGTSVALPVLANDFDPQGQPLMINGYTDPHVAGLTLQVNPDNPTQEFLVTTQPNTPNQRVTFTYSNANAETNSNDATVTFTLHGGSSDTAPVANNDHYTLYMDNDYWKINVLNNDTDPQGLPLTISSVTQMPKARYYNARDGIVKISPDGKSLQVLIQRGALDDDSVSFTYTVSDGREVSALPGKVTIRVPLAPRVQLKSIRPHVVQFTNPSSFTMKISFRGNNGCPVKTHLLYVAAHHHKSVWFPCKYDQETTYLMPRYIFAGTRDFTVKMH